MANFCPNCAAPLDADARFCPSCRASVGVAGALASELKGSLRAGVRSVVSEAGQSVPPSVWASALQIYWLLVGCVALLLGVPVLAVGGGVLSAGSSLSSGLISGGAQAERVLLLGFLLFLTGVFDICLSTVLVYGLLTLKNWTYGVFMVWLPVKVVLGIVTYLAKPSLGEASNATTPFVLIFIIALLVALNIGALVLEFLLVRRARTAMAEA